MKKRELEVEIINIFSMLNCAIEAKERLDLAVMDHYLMEAYEEMENLLRTLGYEDPIGYGDR